MTTMTLPMTVFDEQAAIAAVAAQAAKILPRMNASHENLAAMLRDCLRRGEGGAGSRHARCRKSKHLQRTSAAPKWEVNAQPSLGGLFDLGRQRSGSTPPSFPNPLPLPASPQARSGS